MVGIYRGVDIYRTRWRFTQRDARGVDIYKTGGDLGVDIYRIYFENELSGDLLREMQDGWTFTTGGNLEKGLIF